MRLLVVEDERKNRGPHPEGVCAEGFAVDIAQEGLQALALLTAIPFDVAVLDVMLPGLDGISTVRRLRGAARPARRCSCSRPLLPWRSEWRG